MKTRVFCRAVILFLAVDFLTPAGAQAVTMTLTDLNSTASIDPSSQSGMSNWSVNGTNQLAQQWFWFRTGSTGPESSIDTLPLVGATASDTNLNPGNDKLVLRYGSASTFFIDVTYTLNGTPSSGSDMGEQIAITNNSGSPLDFHFFQYTDFDLGGTAAGDTVTLDNANTVRQFKGGNVIAETVVTPPPNHYELAFFNATLVKLNDANSSTLSDGATTVGPGDVTWAFEWDPTINAGQSFQINKDKNLAIPEPGTLSLISAGLATLVFLRKRR
jgi:hypothetical protein